MALLRAIASLGTDAAPALRAEIEALSPRLEAFAIGWLRTVESRLSNASERVGEPVAPFRVARQIAKDLAKALRAHGLLDEKAEVAGLGCCHVALPGETGDGEIGGELRGLSRFERMLRRERERGRAPVESGRMKVVRPALTVRQPAVVRGRRGAQSMSKRRVASRAARPATPSTARSSRRRGEAAAERSWST